MTDTDSGFDPEDYEGVEEKMATLPRREVRRLERDRKQLADTRAQLDQAQRQLAFAQAGIDVNDPAAIYFLKAYEGDLEPEAIRTAAALARLLPGSGGATSAERAGHEMLSQTAAGGSHPSEEDEVARQLNDVSKMNWRNGDEAQREIMRIVEANQIKLRAPNL